MGIHRKPVGAPDANYEPYQPNQQLQRQESWEVYSDEDEEPATGADKPAVPTYKPYRPPGAWDDHAPQESGTTASATGEPVPNSLRPGGGRAQTNPFLRDSSPSAAKPDIPTEPLARLDINHTGASTNPWQGQGPERTQTTTSSNYATPPTTVTTEPNPWAQEPGGNIAYSPASVTVLDQASNQQELFKSPAPVDDSPWGPPSTSAPQAAAQPPPLPPVPGSLPPPPVLLQPPDQPSPQPSQSSYGENNPFFGQQSNVSHLSRSPSRSPDVVSAPSDDGSGYVDVGKETAPQASQLPPVGPNPDRSAGGSDVVDANDKGKGKAAGSQIDEWRLVDEDGTSALAQGSGSVGERPPLPLRKLSGEASGLNHRPTVDAKTETYQIKNIKWHDATNSQQPRVSPILIQNANGPCPLVALVNALTMTTPPDASDTSLVEVLRSREQISLNLLLDAVFEELMSPRRTDADGALPDVGDLYAFLMGLHTGMNVNPRFIPSPAIRTAFEQTSLTHLDAADRANLIPGTFENTHEMGLYATFKIPLIHGWLPKPEDPVHDAMERQAPSYEDAQNLLFREEELEHKLSSEGLSGQDQQLYQDLISIKGFLEGSATQITAWGIQVISKAIRPGTFAILFRNDHFSTLYCHPQTKELVTLVTDEGFRSHEEIVWESLVDISGRQTQYLSGDFGVVGDGASSTFGGFSEDQGAGWTTVEGRRGGREQQGASNEAPLSPMEQEDRDLALALQLQEEEDQRHQQEQDRRRQEQNLSNQYIEQQGRPAATANRTPGQTLQGRRSVSARGSIAPARTSSSQPGLTVPSPNTQAPRQPPRPTTQTVRSLVPPRRSGPDTHRPAAAGTDAPPPYELAAHDEPFNPPPGHPAHATSTNTSTLSSDATPPPQPARPVRASNALGPGTRPQVPHGGRERDRDCVVM
ncbi:uncharacterized protein J7T54_007311 [Emericellopsis cladophorae]|uniref:MINDY deubiquitinase domain-containing protein n=1 Tax=Emericellopsis cladophorae TaxID=2686198 RepID=A0A9Q0BCZ3_9HYPO|nr:uncharacterized protein J7T54_007311 [Emericellopsis cladophorae]KAI6780832.1 hypothetical protein J7T54_007311 [Emericellopsis cladophorae]